ncbi:MAG: hypothetical protein AAF594_17050 [Bacteroidota bacterium]
METAGQTIDAVAGDWLESWTSIETDGLGHEKGAVVERLGQLLAGRQDGVWFFFSDPVRTRLLMEVLDVPRDDWAALRELATEVIEQGGDPPRMVVDLARGWPNDERGMRSVLGELARVVFSREELHPIDVLVTPVVHERVPTKLQHDLSPGVVFRPFKDHAAVEAEIERLAPTALVLSREPVHPVNHWWAAAFDPNFGAPKLVLAPVDGAQRFADDGALPGPGPVSPSLADIGVTPVDARYPIPDDPQALRELAATLTDPARTRRLGEASKRRALGDKLGIPAAATPEECEGAELDILAASLGLQYRGLDQASLEDRLERAHRVRVGPELWRVGEQLHFITPEVPDIEPSDRLIVHHRPPPESPLEILNRVIDDWTLEDWIADRQLSRLAAERCSPGGNAREWDHARATLLFTGIPVPRRVTKDAQWAEALAELMADDPPAVRLRLHALGEAAVWCRAWPTSEDPVRPELRVAPFFVERGPTTNRIISWAPPVGPLEVDRGSQVAVVTGMERGYGWEEPKEPAVPDYFVPFPPDGPPTVDQWYEAMAASRALGAPAHHAARFFEGAGDDPGAMGRCLPHPDVWQVESYPVPLSDELWRTADRLAGCVWLALRRSTETPSTTLHDNTGLRPIGGGVVAVVRAQRRGQADDRVRISLDARYHTKGKQPGLFRSAGGWRTGTLPSGVHLSGRGWHVDLTFETSALIE